MQTGEPTLRNDEKWSEHVVKTLWGPCYDSVENGRLLGVQIEQSTDAALEAS